MKYYKRTNLVSEKIGKDTLIVDHNRGLLITLNQTAGFIWDLLRRPRSRAEIIEGFTKKYGAKRAIDSTEALKDLEKSGTIIQEDL